MQPDDTGKYLIMDSFDIALKNDKINSYNKSCYLIAGINFIFFIVYAFYAKHGYVRIELITFSLLIIGFSFADDFIRKKNGAKKNSFNLTYCWLIICWLNISIWMVLIHVLLLVFDTISRRKLNVSINKEGIIYPSFPKKNIGWDALQNVVLKDGLLTIDFKDNHLVQDEIEITSSIDETAFNRYCEQQLK